MGGFDFDIGISFDEFEENIKRLMEIPMKYIDTAVEFIEDIHERIYAPSTRDEALNKANEMLKDPSSTTSIGMELVASNKELSSPTTSTIAAQDSFMGSIVTDPHETESISTISPESNSSEGDNIEVNDQCLLPMDTSEAEISGGKTIDVDEEVLLCNSEKSSEICTTEDPILLGRTVSIEEEVILWNPEEPVEPQSSESFACSEAVILGGSIANCEEQTALLEESPKQGANCEEHTALHSPKDPEESTKHGANCEEQTTLHSTQDPEESTTHGDLSNLSSVTLLHDLTTDMFDSTDDSNIWLDDTMQFIEINLQDDQEQTEADVPSVHQPKNTSFKVVKGKERNVNQAVPDRSQEAGNVSYQAVSSSDDLEDDWELL